jgi:hypothetical protein
VLHPLPAAAAARPSPALYPVPGWHPVVARYHLPPGAYIIHHPHTGTHPVHTSALPFIQTAILFPADTAGPPFTWDDKRKAKQALYVVMKHPLDYIHLYIGEISPDDVSNINFKSIWEKYAPQYENSRFQTHFKSMLTHFYNGTGHFNCNSESIELWTSTRKKSEGWHLLHNLLMVAEPKFKLDEMTQEQIWKSNSKFKCYPFQYFEKYLLDMVKLTDVKRADIPSDLESFEKDCCNCPEDERIDRGEPFVVQISSKTTSCRRCEEWACS